MEFGVFGPLRWPQPGDVDAACPAGRDLARAEEQGYHAAWLAEPASSRRAEGPAVQLAAAQLAVRTRRIRIGIALSLPASLHPLRLAEEIAMLDIVSAGRVACCLGRADRIEDPLSSGGTSARRLHEQCAILRRAWEGRPFAFEGELHRFPELACLPTPVQQPHPTLSAAAITEASVEEAGRTGLALIADPISSPERIERCRRLHVAAAPAPRSAGISLLRYVHVAASDRRAREQALPRLRAALRALLAGPESERPVALRALLGERTGVSARDAEADLEAMLMRSAIVGDEARCREALAELREATRVDTLITLHALDELPQTAVQASQQRFIETVAPAFA